MSDKIYSTDELSSLVLIDARRKERVQVNLVDKDGDDIPLLETIQSITEYIVDKMKDDNINQVQQEIYPLMSQAVVASLSRFIGKDACQALLSDETIRYSLIGMMSVGFAFLKFIQKKELSICANRESISEEDLERITAFDKVNSVLTKANMLGINPTEILKEMAAEGLITKELMQELGIDISKIDRGESN